MHDKSISEGKLFGFRSWVDKTLYRAEEDEERGYLEAKTFEFRHATKEGSASDAQAVDVKNRVALFIYGH